MTRLEAVFLLYGGESGFFFAFGFVLCDARKPEDSTDGRIEKRTFAVDSLLMMAMLMSGASELSECESRTAVGRLKSFFPHVQLLFQCESHILYFVQYPRIVHS